MDHAVKVYKLANNLPDSEKFNLSSQLKRAAVSIPSNIAEGSSRTSGKEFAHYLEIALGSSFEIETQILIAYHLGYLSSEEIKELEEGNKILQSGIRNLRDKIKRKAITHIIGMIILFILTVYGITNS